MGEQAMGAPGWPDLAFSTVSTARRRRVSMESWSISVAMSGISLGHPFVPMMLVDVDSSYFDPHDVLRAAACMAQKSVLRFILGPLAGWSACLWWFLDANVVVVAQPAVFF